MNISAMVYAFLVWIAFLGIYMIYKNTYRRGRQYMHFKTLWKKELFNGINRQKELLDSIKRGSDSGFLLLYSLIRYMSIVILGIYFFSNKNPKIVNLVFLLIFTVVTKPVKSMYDRKMLYGYIFDMRNQYRKAKIDKDIFYCMTRLKNLCHSQGKDGVNGEYLLEILLRDTNEIYQEFSRLLLSWRLGDKHRACTLFAKELDTSMSYEFSKILCKLDDVEFDEIVQRLELYQNHIREESMTKNLKYQEVVSYAIYMPIMASAFFIMLNFLVVVVIMDTMNILKNL